MEIASRTIAAVSTPPGKGGVALIRISGEDAVRIASACFTPKSGKPLESYPARYAVYGSIHQPRQDGAKSADLLDDGIATLFRAPASYTGEDTVEISCHGGVLVTREVLEALFSAGACPAERGEFTRRAFLSGRLSLTDAEAVAQLLDAVNPAQLKLTAAKGRELLSGAAGELYARMTRILSSVFARIDYPEEDLGEYTDAEMEEELAAVKAGIDRLAATYKTGHTLSCGVETAIVGAPNVGKSSVYNAMAGEELAIVTEIAGTTRDTLQTTLNLGRIPLKVSDTAGIRETDDPVEAIGVSRAADRLQKAELILAVFDGSRPLGQEDRRVLSLLREKPDCVKIALINKSDLPRALEAAEIADEFSLVLEVSAKDRVGFDALTQAVDNFFTDGELTPGDDAIVFSARQHAALKKASDAAASALDALRRGVPADAVCGEIEGAMRAMGELDGREVSEDVVTDIFSRFCVGK